METLKDLIVKHGANAYVMGHYGNGSCFGEAGQVMEYDDSCDKYLGTLLMTELDETHISEDGVPCHYASDWVVAGVGDNPFRYRVYF